MGSNVLLTTDTGGENKVQNENEKTDKELNFVDEFDLNRNGMIKEIKIEFDIIRLCLQENYELDNHYVQILDRILVMPLRKLLCESNSVLLNVCSDFKMPCLKGFPITVNGLTIIKTPFIVEPIEQWISVQQWLKQNISWFDREPDSIAKTIPKFSYECIIKKLNGKKYKAVKTKFESLFCLKQIVYRNEVNEVYCRNNPYDENENQEIYDILEEIGYNKLSIYNFIKHLSDKRGAHIDVGHSALIDMINTKDKKGMTPVYYFAVQMIYAAKKQIPELTDYWSQMPDLIV